MLINMSPFEMVKPIENAEKEPAGIRKAIFWMLEIPCM